MINLGRKIVEAKETESELEAFAVLFDSNVPYANGSNLFYYPENYNARRDDISKYNPTVEEIVDKCLSYKAIQL